jgi:hypothetical protein
VKILTTDDAALLLGAGDLDLFLRRLTSRLPPAGPVYAISPDARAKTGLAKFLAYLLLKQSSVCIYLTGWGDRPYSEHLDLLRGYRVASGEMRSLSVAPVHVFDSSASDAMVSVLCLVLYFYLEAWIFDVEGKTLIGISRDGKLDIRTDNVEDIKSFGEDPEKYLQPFLAG